MEVDTQTPAPLLPIAQGASILTESMGLVRHENKEVTLSELQARLFLREGDEWVNLGMGKLVFSIGKLSLRAYIAVVSVRSQTVLLDFAIAEAGKRRDRHVYVNAPNPKATSGSPHPRLHCFKFQTEKHAFQLEKRLMALSNRDPVAALGRYLPSHKTATAEQIQRARANYTAARLKQLQESGGGSPVEFPDSFGLHWVTPVRASSAKPRAHPYATISKDRKSRRQEAANDSTARVLAEALAATSITPADQLEQSDNVQTSIFGPLPPPPPPVKWGGFAEFGPRSNRSAGASSKEITPDPTTEPRVSPDFVSAFASQTLQDGAPKNIDYLRLHHGVTIVRGLLVSSRDVGDPKLVLDLAMVSLLRTLRSIRRVGLKEYVRQMWYIGDAKSGRFVGADKFGNRYFENLNPEEELPGRHRWIDYRQHEYNAAQVPSDWHSWLHHIRQKPPTEDKVLQESQKPWQTEYVENLTGTRGAYRPYNTVAPKITAWDPKTRPRA